MADGSTKIKNGLFLKPVSADPSNPAEGDIQFSDGTARAKGLWVYKDGAWTESGSGSGGSGGSGGINYLSGDSSDFENGVGDWVAYADAAAITPVDGTGGAPTTTFAQSADTSLRGSDNGLLTKDAVDRQGEGASCAFTIDEADKAKKLTISFDYITSVDYADDDIKVFVYDVTNASLIRINGEDLKANSNSATHYAQFQTAPDSTSYRLILHISSTNASAYTVRLDNVQVGPREVTNGPIVTDWIDSGYTDTTMSSWTISISGTEYKYRRVGDTVQAKGQIRLNGTPNAVQLKINLPSGLSIDADKIAHQGTVDYTVGTASLFESGVQNRSGRVRYVDSAPTTVEIVDSGNNNVMGGVTSTAPFTWGNLDSVQFQFSVPIAGWSSNAVTSEDLGGRKIVVRAEENSGESITANVTDIPFGTILEDTTASWDGSQFTAPETGTYAVNGMIYATASLNFLVRSYINGVWDRAIGFHNSSKQTHNFSTLVKLNKGDTFSVRASVNMTLNTSTDDIFHYIHIEKLASPQTMLETETVAFTAEDNSGQAITTSFGNITFNTVLNDTHNAYNTSTGEYTIPVSGYYSYSATIEKNSTSAARLELRLDTNIQAGIRRNKTQISTNIASPITCNLNTMYYFNKGTVLTLKADCDQNVNMTSDLSRNHVSIYMIK